MMPLTPWPRPGAFAALAALLLAVGCRNAGDAPSGARDASATRTAARDSLVKDSVARARQDSINRTRPGYVIDSILPVKETLRRFRRAVGGSPVTALAGGSASRDKLVHRFMNALVAGDSLELRAMAVDAREFADLIYPESPSTKPPYQQDPALVWRSIQNPSASGFKRLVKRAGGVPVKLAKYACDSTPTTQGKNTLWSGCLLSLVGEHGDTSTHRFFGAIVERDGQFKFMSYRNEF